MFVAKKEIQLFYADTDMMGVMYHANYLKWFELGRTALIEELGYKYTDMEEAGYYAPVYDIQVTYKTPLRYGDHAYVHTWIEENNRLKTLYGYEIRNQNNQVCATGTSTHIVVKKDNFRPIQFSKAFPEWFAKYEEIKRK